MGWRDRLREASFRGVPFFVETAEGAYSRNVVEHEYPGQAPPFFEDLGRRARAFELEAYVLGEDYQDQRDRLIAAIDEQEGPGDLVHPYLGTLRVLARSLRVRESSREGRMARFLIAFVEASEASSPAATDDAPAELDAATGSLFTATEDDFAASWDPTDEPAILVQAGSIQAQDFFDYLRGLNLRGPLDEVSAWRDKLDTLANGAIAALQTPGQFARDVTSLLDGLRGTIGSAKYAIEAFLGLLDVKPSRSFGHSSASQNADRNRDAVGRIFRESGAALGARSSAEVDWASFGEAQAARDRALAAITSAQDTAGDATFVALGAVAQALSSALPLAPGTLPEIQAYTVGETTNALAIAYELFDDVSRADELVARNRIRNPLVVVGGQTLEVLADA